MATIDSLDIRIQSSAQKANQAIDTLVKNLGKISKALNFDTSSLKKLSEIDGNNLKKIGVGIQSFSDAAKNLKNVSKFNFTKLANGIEKIADIQPSKLEALGKIKGTSFKNIGEGLKAFSEGARQLKSVKEAVFDKLASGIGKLADIQTGNLEAVGNALKPFAAGVNILSNAKIDSKNLQTITSSLKQLSKINVSGLDTVSKANFAGLGTGINEFISHMSDIGKINRSVIEMTEAAANLASAGVKMTVASKELDKFGENLEKFMQRMSSATKIRGDTIAFTQAIGTLASAGENTKVTADNIGRLASKLTIAIEILSKAPTISKSTIQLAKALGQLAGSSGKLGINTKSLKTAMSSFASSSKQSIPSTSQLTKSISKLSDSVTGLETSLGKITGKIKSFSKKIFSMAGSFLSVSSAIKSSMDYIENLNYFNAAFGQVADSADLGAWQKLGYESATTYYDSFAQRAEQLTSKLSGFSVSESGMLSSTGKASLGLDPSQVMQYQAMFGQMSSSMGIASETSLKLSQALTEIGGDLASVKNMNFDKVWEDMASGLTGMSRTLDKYGVNIRNVNLQQKLNELGINANISALNQNDKALLRTIILLDSTRYAWGDLAGTLSQPANQLRLLEANFQNLSRTIGNIFLPIVATVLPYLNAMLIVLQKLAQGIVGLLGFEGFSWGGLGGGSEIVSDLLDNVDDTASGLDNATESAKKLKSQLRGFDELKTINTQQESGGQAAGAGGAGSGLLDKAFEDSLSEYQKAWDAAFEQMENKPQEIADKIQDSMSKIFAPFKAAWESEGQTTVDSFQTAFSNVKSVAETVGTTLSQVFTGQTGIDWLESDLKLLQSFLDVIGSIADAFETAWNTGKTGTKFVESIFTMFTTINDLLTSINKTIADAFKNGTGTEWIQSVLDMFTSINDIVETLATTLEEAWSNGAGLELVTTLLESLTNIQDLVTSISDSFSRVWSNGTGVEIWENLLGIVTGVSDTIGNLATQLQTAWDTAGLGDSIWQGILNIVNTILETIHNIADSTAVWAENLDFTPLLESIDTLLKNLEPLTENIGSGLEWFWNNVLLPIASWTIEEAVPTFLDMLSTAIDTLNQVIETLQPLGTWFWENLLLPIGQWTGDIIIGAMEKISELLGNFSDWISTHQEEVENMTIIIGSFFAAFKITKTVSGITDLVNKMGGLSGTISGIKKLIGGVLNPWTVALGGLVAAGILVYKNWDTIKAKAGELIEKFEPLKQFIDRVKGLFSGLTDFIKGVFTGDWELAWKGVVKIFKNIFKGIVSVAQNIINSVIGFVNALINGLNKVTGIVGIPAIPNIPEANFVDKFEKGGLVLKHTFAEIGEHNKKEAVLPLENKRTMRMIADTILENTNYNTNDNFINNPISNSNDSLILMRQLLNETREQNRLLQRILQKPNLGNEEIFEAARKVYKKEATRRYGNSAYFDSIWG